MCVENPALDLSCREQWNVCLINKGGMQGISRWPTCSSFKTWQVPPSPGPPRQCPASWQRPLPLQQVNPSPPPSLPFCPLPSPLLMVEEERLPISKPLALPQIESRCIQEGYSKVTHSALPAFQPPLQVPWQLAMSCNGL